MPLMSLRAYSRHRGCTLNAVQCAIASGRISKTGSKIDSEAADVAWAANTDAAMARHRKSRGDEKLTSNTAAYLEERTQRERLRRQREQMAFDLESGKLARIEDLMEFWSKMVVVARTKLLGVPSKLKSQRPGMSREDVLLVDKLIREALEEIAEEKGGETTEEGADD